MNKKKLTFRKALNAAKTILKENPNFVLTGSLALMLAGELDPREMGDIDFAVDEFTLTKEQLKMLPESSEKNYPPEVHCGAKCYQLEDWITGANYSLFVYEEDFKRQLLDIDYTHAPREIWAAKKAMSRDKDKKDNLQN